MSFIGIDIGATFLKGAVLDVENMKVTNIIHSPFPSFIEGRPYGYREIEPMSIVSIVENMLGNLLLVSDTCEGILFCCQMHGLVIVDSDRRAISPFISWQDTRSLQKPHGKTLSSFELLCERTSPIMRTRTGNELRPGIPLAFLFHMAKVRELPEEVVPIGLSELVISSLTGGPPLMEKTMAHAHGAYNLETGHWDEELIASCGLEKLVWPIIVSTGTIAGFLERGKGKIPCYVAVGDQQCSLLGAGIRPGELSINIATGSQISTLNSSLLYGNYQTRPYFQGYLNTITHIPAGRSLNLLVKLLTEYTPSDIDVSNIWSFIESRVECVPETDLEVNVSFFPSACGNRGHISNINEDNLSIGHLFRAAFENMADNYQMSAMKLPGSESWQKIIFSGGLASHSKTLREMIAKKFNLSFQLTPLGDDSLFGLLALARAVRYNVTPELSAEEIRQARYDT
jgi:sugar (pentulose or hexulose) kinase